MKLKRVKENIQEIRIGFHLPYKVKSQVSLMLGIFHFEIKASLFKESKLLLFSI
jgi:hypothetical protein